MEPLTPEQLATMTPEQIAAYYTAQAQANKPPVTPPSGGGDFLARLNASITPKAINSQTLNLKLEWVKDGVPTKTGIPRKLIKFAEIASPIFVLIPCINGIIKEGNSYPVEFTERITDGKSYINISSIKGDRTSAMDGFDYLMQRRDNRAAFSLS